MAAIPLHPLLKATDTGCCLERTDPEWLTVHVLHIIVGLEFGGAELMLARLIACDHSTGEFRHSVISLTTTGAVGARLQAAGVAVHALGLKGPAGMVRGLWQLRRLIRKLRPEIVHTWMYHAAFLGGLAAIAAGHRRIVWCIRATHVEFEGSLITVWLARACAFLSRWIPQKIICAAEASRRAHVAIGYDAARMIVIPNGFDVAPLKTASQERFRQRRLLRLTDEAIVMGAIGRFNPVKDFHNFIRAAADVARRIPAARFILIGRGLTRDNAQLMSWIVEAGIVDRCILLGERRDIPACLAAMDIFCLSSRSEGFPNVVGEAMGVGVPCVVTDAGDAALLVGDTGLVVPPGDSVALGSALTQLAGLSVHERRARGANAQLRIEIEFSIRIVRQQYAAVYRQLVNGRQESA